MSNDQRAYDDPEDVLEELREAEGSSSEGEAPTEYITKNCNMLMSVSTCKLAPYEREDGRIVLVGTGCDRKCKFP